MVEDGDEVVVDEDSPSAELDELDVAEVALDVVGTPGIDALLVDDDELLLLELVDVVVGTAHTRLVEVGSGLPLS